ncbi:MAG: M48 family metalloprotease [Pseudomonadota bacterium]
MPRIYRTLLLAAAAALCTACGTNPVTGEREVQLISEAQEIQMGARAYGPARQVQGGDYIVYPELTLYVQSVNQRLAQVSDRDLPYDINIINSSVPNAWAMPGGKMAINRGLLLELGSEAELAAVLGHEIVHAAARHGAKSQERGLFLQSGVVATDILTGGRGGALAGGALAGATLINSRYGREAELEADEYGMLYMVRAGYDPAAAVDLQQTFVRLSQGSDPSWLDGLFASHPPSAERVRRNQETAAELGNGELDVGRERYQRAIADLRRDKPAYDALDAALAAAEDEDYVRAEQLINKAISLQPREAKFHGMKGDLALQAARYEDASRHYNRAIGLYPGYFGFFLHLGYARFQLEDWNGATRALERCNDILPNALAQKVLGDLALRRGDREQAIAYYEVAAQSESEVGQAALVALIRLELAEYPDKYIRTQVGVQDGKVAIAVDNLTPVTLTGVVVIAVFVDAQGQATSRVSRVKVPGELEPRSRRIIETRFTSTDGLRTAVEKARIAETEEA